MALRGAAAVVAGLAVVAAHAAGFAALAPGLAGPELAVRVRGPLAVPGPGGPDELRGEVPPGLAGRVTAGREGGAPGLVHTTWQLAYRGGHARAVGATQLVGPFQDPAAPACTGRVIVGQRLLDDGRAGAGTVAGQLVASLTTDLAGLEVFPLGTFARVEGVAVRWARLDAHPEDRGFVGAAPHGYIRAALTIRLARAAVPLVIALVPVVDGGAAPAGAARALRFRLAARAQLALGNRVAQWLSDRLGGDRLASTLARRELDRMLVTTLAPPPPLEVPGGPALRFAYCDAPPEIVDGVAGALPFAVVLGEVPGAPAIRPPRQGPGPRPPLDPRTPLALELELDALNALLYELWRGGALDRELAAAGLDRRFNTDPLVTRYLSLRISPVRLALPPALRATATGLRLAADGRVAIADGGRTTTGRVWGAVDLTFGAAAPPAPGAPAVVPADVRLGALTVACERAADVLVPCYADLVGALRGRGAELGGALTAALSELVTTLFVDRRLAADGLPAAVVIRAVTPRLHLGGGAASLRLDLDAALAPAPP